MNITVIKFIYAITDTRGISYVMDIRESQTPSPSLMIVVIKDIMYILNIVGMPLWTHGLYNIYITGIIL
jgi:hypothetical protein